MKDLKVVEIPWTETLDLRQRVLRPGRPPLESHFSCDDKPTTFHLAVKREGDPRALAIATFVKETHPELGGTNSYRLRGMAVDPEFRRLRFGEKLLLAGEEHLRKVGTDMLWFNAREEAFSFYKSCGYIDHGPMFEIAGVGLHKVMWKRF